MEPSKVNEQETELINLHESRAVNDAQPGCSHWSTTVQNPSSSNSSSEEEEKTDDKYVENTRQMRELMHKPLNIPLDDLLNFIEAYSSDKNADKKGY